MTSPNVSEAAMPGAAQSNAQAATAEEPGGNLEKIRDILFGHQMRDSDRRFARLEERLSQETQDLKEEVRKRLGILEQFVKQELEALATRISAEHQERTDSAKELSRELREMGSAFERKASQLEDHSGRIQRELRQQLLDQQVAMTEEIRQKVDEILARLARESSEIRNDKLDRAALAAILTDMAMRLADELSLPNVSAERA
jgi:DNA anti-recombination protein RmuC